MFVIPRRSLTIHTTIRIVTNKSRSIFSTSVLAIHGAAAIQACDWNASKQVGKIGAFATTYRALHSVYVASQSGTTTLCRTIKQVIVNDTREVIQDGFAFWNLLLINASIRLVLPQNRT